MSLPNRVHVCIGSAKLSMARFVLINKCSLEWIPYSSKIVDNFCNFIARRT